MSYSQKEQQEETGIGDGWRERQAGYAVNCEGWCWAGEFDDWEVPQTYLCSRLLAARREGGREGRVQHFTTNEIVTTIEISMIFAASENMVETAWSTFSRERCADLVSRFPDVLQLNLACLMGFVSQLCELLREVQHD